MWEKVLYWLFYHNEDKYRKKKPVQTKKPIEHQSTYKYRASL